MSHHLRNLAKKAFTLAPYAIKRWMLGRVYAPHIAVFRQQEAIGLFDAISLELRTRCNGLCQFCAASVKEEKRLDQTMSFDIFSKIVSELEAMNYRGRIAFNVNNDPLIVPDLLHYVTYSRRRLPLAWLQITTNGKALRNELATGLLKAGINEMCINWYTQLGEETLPENIRQFRDETLPNTLAGMQILPGHGPVEGQKLFRFNLTKRRIDEVLTNRAGSAPNKRGKIQANPFGFCNLPFTQINITADGRVSKCCADFYFDHAMGNLATQTLEEIWNGEEFRNLRQSLLKNRRKDIQHCGQCDFIGIKPGRYRSWIDSLAATSFSNP
ncbi:MAG: radical SAM/SPASM domain-containing protein [Alphaproteobacteria bacterium]|nr:radical SAM/SPASM domain-containing protein [Alphaproteobacteria bacterium]